MTTRYPAFAGQFYPDDQSQLKEQISEYLSSVSTKVDSNQVKILIVPHAGYKFSGKVAATGYKQLENQNINKVILLGSSHQSYFENAAVDNRDQWQTPLGKVKTDQEMISKLCENNETINCNFQPHNQEHSLEVQLPFLQTVLDNFKITPILLGQVDNQTINQLSTALQRNLDSNTLLVISTDLSHYPNYEIANQVDDQTINSILTGDPKKFNQKIKSLMAQGYPNLQTCACAVTAVKIGLNISQNIDGQWQKIKYANSGDVTGDKSRVVGYTSLVFSSKYQVLSKQKDQKAELNQDQKQKLLDIARKTLEKYLITGEKTSFDINDSALQSKLGVFVTLNKNGGLRGCMGNFKPDTPLWQTVQDQAIIAATKDPRFPEVTSEEVNDLEIEISVLSTPKKIDDWKEIELGNHGVIVKNGNRSGTYLPQVGTEHPWENTQEFLSHLCSQKASLPPDSYLDKDTDLLIYTADVFSE